MEEYNNTTEETFPSGAMSWALMVEFEMGPPEENWEEQCRNAVLQVNSSCNINEDQLLTPAQPECKTSVQEVGQPGDIGQYIMDVRKMDENANRQTIEAVSMDLPFEILTQRLHEATSRLQEELHMRMVAENEIFVERSKLQAVGRMFREEHKLRVKLEAEIQGLRDDITNMSLLNSSASLHVVPESNDKKLIEELQSENQALMLEIEEMKVQHKRAFRNIFYQHGELSKTNKALEEMVEAMKVEMFELNTKASSFQPTEICECIKDVDAPENVQDQTTEEVLQQPQNPPKQEAQETFPVEEQAPREPLNPPQTEVQDSLKKAEEPTQEVEIQEAEISQLDAQKPLKDSEEQLQEAQDQPQAKGTTQESQSPKEKVQELTLEADNPKTNESEEENVEEIKLYVCELITAAESYLIGNCGGITDSNAPELDQEQPEAEGTTEESQEPTLEADNPKTSLSMDVRMEEIQLYVCALITAASSHLIENNPKTSLLMEEKVREIQLYMCELITAAESYLIENCGGSRITDSNALELDQDQPEAEGTTEESQSLTQEVQEPTPEAHNPKTNESEEENVEEIELYMLELITAAESYLIGNCGGITDSDAPETFQEDVQEPEQYAQKQVAQDPPQGSEKTTEVPLNSTHKALIEPQGSAKKEAEKSPLQPPKVENPPEDPNTFTPEALKPTHRAQNPPKKPPRLFLYPHWERPEEEVKQSTQEKVQEPKQVGVLLKKPSLWRRFKKWITPKQRRRLFKQQTGRA